MKLTRLLLFMALIVVAGSCSKDDDNGPAPFVFNKDNLTGTYSMVFFESKEVRTREVDGFDVTTTTIKKGDTFTVTSSFDSDGKVTNNGTYRISWTKTQYGDTQEGAEIIVLDNKRSDYSIDASNSDLTIDDKTYKVSGFTRTGFTLKMSKTTSESGVDLIYEEELRFTR